MMPGPYQTELDAALAAGSWLDLRSFEGVLERDGNEAWRDACLAAARQRLADAVHRAGVETGAYDEHVLDWLSGWEAETVEVIASLIERAEEAGMRHAGGES